MFGFFLDWLRTFRPNWINFGKGHFNRSCSVILFCSKSAHLQRYFTSRRKWIMYFYFLHLFSDLGVIRWKRSSHNFHHVHLTCKATHGRPYFTYGRIWHYLQACAVETRRFKNKERLPKERMIRSRTAAFTVLCLPRRTYTYSSAALKAICMSEVGN